MQKVVDGVQAVLDPFVEDEEAKAQGPGWQGTGWEVGMQGSNRRRQVANQSAAVLTLAMNL
jgi:hypothetical protein